MTFDIVYKSCKSLNNDKLLLHNHCPKLSIPLKNTLVHSNDVSYEVCSSWCGPSFVKKTKMPLATFFNTAKAFGISRCGPIKKDNYQIFNPCNVVH